MGIFDVVPAPGTKFNPSFSVKMMYLKNYIKNLF
jgi:hypothetical protein